MDRRSFLRWGTAALSGAAAGVPSIAYARPRSKDLQGLTLDAKITDLKTGQPIPYTARFLTKDEFNEIYGKPYVVNGRQVPGVEITESDKVGVELTSPRYVTYATAGYPDAGVVTLANVYGDTERGMIPESDLVLKEMCSIIARTSIDTLGLIKHPDLRVVDYQIKAAADSSEAQVLEEVLKDAVKRVTNGYVSLENGKLSRNPGLTKPTTRQDWPLNSYWTFPDPTLGVGTGSLRKVTKGNSIGFYSQIQLPYIGGDWIARIREEIFGALGMFGEPGAETGTYELEAKIAQMGGTVFGGDKSGIKADNPNISDLDNQVIKFFATRPLGNRKLPSHERFPKIYDVDPGHVLLPEQRPQRPLTGDFDGNGEVNLDDFFAFAGVFGERKGSSGYNSVFDLDGDGMIGFGDFFIFAENFGRKR